MFSKTIIIIYFILISFNLTSKLYEIKSILGVVINSEENIKGRNDWAPKNNLPPQ